MRAVPDAAPPPRLLPPPLAPPRFLALAALSSLASLSASKSSSELLLVALSMLCASQQVVGQPLQHAAECKKQACAFGGMHGGALHPACVPHLGFQRQAPAHRVIV